MQILERGQVGFPKQESCQSLSTLQDAQQNPPVCAAPRCKAEAFAHSLRLAIQPAGQSSGCCFSGQGEASPSPATSWISSDLLHKIKHQEEASASVSLALADPPP